MILAREVSDPLTSLVKKIDAATLDHKDAHMGSFVVFCTNKNDMEKQVKGLADKEKVKQTILTVLDNPSGPPSYKMAKDAEVTVVLYHERKVVANHAFKKGELNDLGIEDIVKDIAKILPKKDEKK
jgi:hypothetical protein